MVYKTKSGPSQKRDRCENEDESKIRHNRKKKGGKAHENKYYYELLSI